MKYANVKYHRFVNDYLYIIIDMYAYICTNNICTKV